MLVIFETLLKIFVIVSLTFWIVKKIKKTQSLSHFFWALPILALSIGQVVAQRIMIYQYDRNISDWTAYNRDIIAGKFSIFEAQTRVLVPFISYFFNLLSHDDATVFSCMQTVVNFFSYSFLFLLARSVSKNNLASFMTVLVMGCYISLGMGPLNMGVPILFGIFCALSYFVIRQNYLGITIISFLGILQRPDLVMCGLFFNFLYIKFYIKNMNHKSFATTAVLGVFAVGIPQVLKKILHADQTVYIEKLHRWACDWRSCPSAFNIEFLSNDFLLFLPIVLGFAYRPKISKLCKLMLISLAPYFVLFSAVGDYTEPRLFLPIIAVSLVAIFENLVSDLQYLSASFEDSQ